MTQQDDTSVPGAAAAQPGAEAGALPSPGAHLRALREAAQMSVDDVAQQLKLSRRQVLAIENDEIDALPGPTFARGFIRNYARLLRVDPEPLLQSGPAAAPAPEPMQPIARSMGELPQEDGGSGNWTRWVIPAGLVVVLIAGIALYEFTNVGTGAHRPRKEVSEPSVQPPSVPGTGVSAPATAQPGTTVPDAAIAPPATAMPDVRSGTVAPPVVDAAPSAAANASASGTGPAAAPAASAPSAQSLPDAARPAGAGAATGATVPAGAPASGASPAVASATPQSARPAGTETPIPASAARLDFDFASPSWVEVRDGKGEVLFSRTMAARTTQTVAGTPPLSIHLGNARGVSLRYNGTPVDIKPYTRQEIARLTLPARGR